VSSLYRYSLYCFVTLFIILLSEHAGYGQVQLVLLKHERVVLRLNPGDDFIYKLKNSRTIKSSYVNNLSDTAVVTHSEVVPFHTIDRIYFSQSKFYNRVGSALFVGGAALFLIDQFNVTLVQGDKPNLDSGVSITSLAMVGAGLPMMLIRKKSQRIKHKYHLMMAKKGSPFYQPDPHSFLD
jgi:hypothetical protein